MENTLLTAGQFAKLARTTKRTIAWYEKEGILLPSELTEKKYRLYKQNQILDYQVILLMRKLGFSLEEIKHYLQKHDSLKEMFIEKGNDIKKEIHELEETVRRLDEYYTNLEKYGTLVLPIVKNVPSFSLYTLSKVGPYAKIGEYINELKSYFTSLPQNIEFVTLFLDKGYQPKRAKMKIGVVRKKGMQLLRTASGKIIEEKVPAYKTLSYSHNGSSTVLSMIWQEMEKYAKKNRFVPDRSLPFVDLEFYRIKGQKIISEINYPVL